MISGAGSGSDSEVSNGDVVVGAVDSEDCGSEDSGAEVGVDASAAWVGSDVGTLVAGLVAELEGSADWEDEEVAVGVLAAAIWGAGSELEDGVEAGVVRDGAGAGAGAEATSLAAAMAAAPAAEAARELAWESSPWWPPRGSLWWCGVGEEGASASGG